MKLIFAAEDTVVGIICGLLLIGFTGTFFSLKLSDIIYVIAFIIYAFFILLDIFNEMRDLTTHFGFIMFSLLHSLADLLIALTAISHFSGWSMPYITSVFVPYLQNASMMLYAGIFLVVGNVIWLVLYPFLD